MALALNYSMHHADFFGDRLLLAILEAQIFSI
jgi:hypothetical protein